MTTDPSNPGASANRQTQVENTTVANAFEEMTFAEIGDDVDHGFKTVFLTRTGSYIGIYKRTNQDTTSSPNTYSYGKLPTLKDQYGPPGFSYGPYTCHYKTSLMSTDVLTANQMRTCGRQ